VERIFMNYPLRMSWRRRGAAGSAEPITGTVRRGP